MKQMNLLFIYSLLFYFIKSQSQIKSNNSSKTDNEEIIDYTKKFNLTIDEMDKMLHCSIFIQKALSKDKDRIEL